VGDLPEISHPGQPEPNRRMFEKLGDLQVALKAASRAAFSDSPKIFCRNWQDFQSEVSIKFLNGDIPSKTDLTTMTTAPNNAANYAYGWDTGTDSGQKVFAKSGGQPGARAYIRCYPDKKNRHRPAMQHPGRGHQ